MDVDDQSDFEEYNEDEDDYVYEEDDCDEQCFSSPVFEGLVGIKYTGDESEIFKVPQKLALYPIYKQLSKIGLVEIEESYYKSTMTIKTRNNQFLILLIIFPSVQPFFPNAPPIFELKSTFKPPNQRYNIVFNHHPQLLPKRWNFCTDLIQIVNDIVKIAEDSVIETFEDTKAESSSSSSGLPQTDVTLTPLSNQSVKTDSDDSKQNKILGEGLTVYRRVILLFQTYSIDITGLFPETQFNSLPSFGILKKRVTFSDDQFRGTGYSSGKAEIKDWSFDDLNMTKIDNLSSLSIMIEEETKNGIIDQLLVDCISFILSCWLSSKITIEEFFKHLDYYEKCLDSVLRLPEASAHLPVLEGFIGLMNSFAEINNDFTKILEEEQEIRVLQKLEKYYNRVTNHFTNSDVLEVRVNKNQQEIDKSMEKLVGKKRRSSDNEEQTKMSSPEEKADPTRRNNPRVVDIEEPFKIHKFLSDMNATKNLPSKWMKRLMIELCSMPDSLPDSITVVTGRQCSQPNLLKVFLHPESVDCPYYGGCFEFDVFIPHDYPFKPPKVQLITTGGGSVRFNPNLYNCDKVCLSLLGTWSGEKWNPQVSSLSQVFTSILYLIFVDEPYFNEPGYQSQQGTANGIKCSMSYNSNIRYQTLRFAYLEHFIQGKKNPDGLINQFILPKLAQKWYEKGREIAEGWCVQQREWIKKGINPKLTEENMLDVFTRINQAVENYNQK